jgi:nucleoside 2-deoxyribosyltransferase
VIVVGGTYGERCIHPQRDDVIGSGLRAASVLTTVSPDVVLHTAVCDPEAEAADALAGAVDLNVMWRTRDEPVAFEYFTPLSAPIITGARAHAEHINAEDDVALVFGMLEDTPTVRARKLIYDPQRPRDLAELDIDSVTFDELAIVANAIETRILGGNSDATEAARTLLASSGAVAIVTKQGAKGALVTTAAGQTHVAPRPTAHVWPIGSGDCFAAGFAWAWGDGADPVEAARVGSAVAAAWCERGSLPLRRGAFEGTGVPPELDAALGRVYLAAPFFTLAEHWFVELVMQALTGIGADVFSPLHDVGPGGIEVAQQDLAGLAESQAVLALLDGNDPGTIFETGWACARGIPTVGFTSTAPDDEEHKMLAGTGALLRQDLSTAVYHAAWCSAGWTP